jgi:vacuolar-type H+-ATPase subunit C/Vma6
MNKKEFMQSLPDEEYSYISGLLKVRENLLINRIELDSILNLNSLEDILRFLKTKEYPTKEKMKDTLEIENSLWRKFYNELSVVKKLLPEKYLIYFLRSFQEVIYSKNNNNYEKEKDDIEFRDKLYKFHKISSGGSAFTEDISDYLLDKYNLSEYIRSIIYNTDHEIIFYQKGKLSSNSVIQILNPQNSIIPDEVKNSYWFDFFNLNYPIKIDFNFINNLEKYWFKILYTLTGYQKYRSYGFDFILSYFIRLLLEIININKIILSNIYGLPLDLTMENFINA